MLFTVSGICSVVFITYMRGYFVFLAVVPFFYLMVISRVIPTSVRKWASCDTTMSVPM